MNQIVFLLAGAIITSLAIIATIMWFKVYQTKLQQRKTATELERALEDKRIRLSQDIRFIAQAMLEKQCEMTEGCMRIKVLLDLLDQRFINHPDVKQLQSYYSMVAHLPTHQAYKNLSRQEQFKFDRERFALEETYRATVYVEIEKLSQFDLDWAKAIPSH